MALAQQENPSMNPLPIGIGLAEDSLLDMLQSENGAEVSECGANGQGEENDMEPKREMAAVKIQKQWRMYAAKKKYLSILKRIILIQSLYRGYVQRKEFSKIWKSRHLSRMRSHSSPSLNHVSKDRITRTPTGRRRRPPSRLGKGSLVTPKIDFKTTTDDGDGKGSSLEADAGGGGEDAPTSSIPLKRIAGLSRGGEIPAFDPSKVILKKRGPAVDRAAGPTSSVPLTSSTPALFSGVQLRKTDSKDGVSFSSQDDHSGQEARDAPWMREVKQRRANRPQSMHASSKPLLHPHVVGHDDTSGLNSPGDTKAGFNPSPLYPRRNFLPSPMAHSPALTPGQSCGSSGFSSPFVQAERTALAAPPPPLPSRGRSATIGSNSSKVGIGLPPPLPTCGQNMPPPPSSPPLSQHDTDPSACKNSMSPSFSKDHARPRSSTVGPAMIRTGKDSKPPPTRPPPTAGSSSSTPSSAQGTPVRGSGGSDSGLQDRNSEEKKGKEKKEKDKQNKKLEKEKEKELKAASKREKEEKKKAEKGEKKKKGEEKKDLTEEEKKRREDRAAKMKKRTSMLFSKKIKKESENSSTPDDSAFNGDDHQTVGGGKELTAESMKTLQEDLKRTDDAKQDTHEETMNSSASPALGKKNEPGDAKSAKQCADCNKKFSVRVSKAACEVCQKSFCKKCVTKEKKSGWICISCTAGC